MYNKTALYRMKKDDLMKLFLDQQAEKNQLVLESEENKKVKSHMIYMGHDKMKADLKKLKEENKKLKNRIEEDHKAVPSFRIQDMYRDVKEENEKLKILVQKYQDASLIHNDATPEEITEVMEEYEEAIETMEEKIEELEEENEKLKEQLDEQYSFSYFKQVKELTAESEKLKQQIDYAYKQINELMSKIQLSTI